MPAVRLQQALRLPERFSPDDFLNADAAADRDRTGTLAGIGTCR
jgi:hypothetical protein